MTSRLDRLVTLLDTGSTQLIRNTAAEQLADIQKKHPDELFNLLTRVLRYLKSKNWDTRVAAAKAIGGIVENAEKFRPNGEIDNDAKPEGDVAIKKEDEDNAIAEDQLQLETLDVDAILTHGKKLLGSAGKEYDYFLNSMDPKDRLAHQKKTLSSRLGLGGEYTDADLIDESDLVKNPKSQFGQGGQLPTLKTSLSRSQSMSIHDDDAEAQSPGPADEGSLSARQLNALKRKNKKEMKNQANKVRVVDLSERRMSTSTPRTPHTAEPHAIKAENTNGNGSTTNGVGDYFNLNRTGGDDEQKIVSEFKGVEPPGKSELQPDEEEEDVDWPFDRLCEYMMTDLFDHNWEVRHGAAIGLREVIRTHGAGAGRQKGNTKAQNDRLNQRWLEDLACRTCCLFILDRFGDYVSDNVVAPVRESAGQTLGAVLQYLSPDAVQGVYRILYRLVMQSDIGNEKRIWQACHGGMTGMRYLVAVRTDQLLKDRNLMDGVLEAVIKGLGDWDDDVRAVSAATLVPISREFVELKPAALSSLIRIVWDSLSNLSDDLSASTGSVMDLLAKLCSFAEVLEVMKSNAAEDDEQTFSRLVPRLYPFLRHTITGVRSAVLRALLTFLNIDGEGTTDWIDGKTFRLVFQNLIVERDEKVLELTLKLWNSLVETVSTLDEERLMQYVKPHLQSLITMTTHPIGVPRESRPMDPSLFIRPSGQVFVLPNYAHHQSSPQSNAEPPTKKRRKSIKDREPSPQPASPHNIDGPMILGDVDLVGAAVLTRAKIFAAKAFGKLMSVWPADQMSELNDKFIPHLQSLNSSTRLTVGIVAEEYAMQTANLVQGSARSLIDALHPLLQDDPPPYYSDIVFYLRVAQSKCHELRTKFEKDAGVPYKSLPDVGAKCQGDGDTNKYAFSLEQGDRIVSTDFDRLWASVPAYKRMMAKTTIDLARSEATQALDEARTVKENRDIAIKASAAAAIVAFKDLPKKQSLTVKCLTDSVKAEENFDLQKRSAHAVVSLIQLLIANGKGKIADKVVGNLAKFYCADVAETPEFMPNIGLRNCVMTLIKDENISDHKDEKQFEIDAKAIKNQRRGAKAALDELMLAFGHNLLRDLPALKDLIKLPLETVFANATPEGITDDENTIGQAAIDSMSTLRALVPSFHPDIHPFVLELLPLIIKALKSDFAVFRYIAAKCLATIVKTIPVQGFTALVNEVLPLFGIADQVVNRQGAIECVYHLIRVMEEAVLPYVIFLIVPVLGRMSDADNDVRLLATTTFATLVKLVPLEAGIPDPPGLSQELLEGRERERKFMAQMLDFKKVEPFELPIVINAQLRSYQQEGVNWLAFLNRYHLHGVLCDDMGLGKTLQTLCIVASDIHMRAEEYAKTKNEEFRKLPSLIVCPPTLAGHWQQEIKQYAPFLSALAYVGQPSARSKLRPQIPNVDVVITSYEICRNDKATICGQNWNYCVLDEGHLIKNPSAQITLAVKQLKSYHRLILSGTPIQNNVLELWSLFDFLMPGFLGTEKVFKSRFAKPIANSRNAKSSSKEQEAGALALEALHKQVLPFLLRRLKDEVLDDLPPKILQNYYCDLSELQKKLFEDFTKKEGKAIKDMASSGDKESKQHIFTALNYMRKLCNSPALVVKQGHKQYDEVQKLLQAKNSKVQDYVHAPKLSALRELLVGCGIGSEPSEDKKDDAGGQVIAADEAVSQHRALIFCQMKEMLDIVQRYLDETLRGVSYLRLDGGVEASRRQDIVNRFNGDPSYDVLLLTTSVGGLGLNLTGADTVIFVEHDWNPQKDIQAMDRAHRIGQKKVVNVYRLITRGTLEEKIMSLQRFKIDVASTVVNQQNAGLATMETDQILDLFSLGEGVEEAAGAKEDGVAAVDEVTGEIREKGKKGFLDDLGELWDESQYQDEYNLDEFLSKMNV